MLERAALEAQVYIAQRIGMFSASHASELVTACQEVSAMFHGLLQSLKLKT